MAPCQRGSMLSGVSANGGVHIGGANGYRETCKGEVRAGLKGKVRNGKEARRPGPRGGPGRVSKGMQGRARTSDGDEGLRDERGAHRRRGGGVECALERTHDVHEEGLESSRQCQVAQRAWLRAATRLDLLECSLDLCPAGVAGGVVGGDCGQRQWHLVAAESKACCTPVCHIGWAIAGSARARVRREETRENDRLLTVGGRYPRRGGLGDFARKVQPLVLHRRVTGRVERCEMTREYELNLHTAMTVVENQMPQYKV